MPAEGNQNDDGNQGDAKKNDESVNNQRDFLKMVAQKIFHQIKNGCNKDLCLNIHCRNNAFGKYILSFFEFKI